MKRPRTNCREIGKILGAYHDGELSPSAAAACERHLETCSRCRRSLGDYRSIGRGLAGMAREAGEGGEISLWPEVRRLLREGRPAVRPERTGGRFSLVLRPAWVGLGLSVAAALILFFSGVFTGERLPANYCRIESINAPEHNLMIHQSRSDGLTIIWLTE